MEKNFIMTFNPLREAGRQDFHPKPGIEDSLNGVSFDYYYTGKRNGPSGQIELHITSIVTDWQENVYVRKAWFMGHKHNWKEVVRCFLREHMDDLDTGIQLIKAKLRDFEVSKEKFVPWERYNPVYYGLYE